ncbi:MAG: hypothetical protein N2517_01385 [Ignavibacteria bacterium]|nr:hypothetical protein [Ignavibacteria bacterium]
MKFFYYFILFLIAISGQFCVKKDIEKTFDQKFEPKLKILMNNPEYLGGNKKIRCILEMYRNLDFIIKDKLEAVGLKVITEAGNIIVVEGDVVALRKASRYDFIHRIGLSQEYKFE